MSDTAPTVHDAAVDMLNLGISWQTVERLARPTPADEVQTRPDRATYQHKPTCQGRACPSQNDPAAHVQLSYVNARYVMRVLTEVAGPYWQRDHKPINGSVACGIGILIDGQWIWRWDGAGETDIEGQKGAYSDSFKRAGVSWGIARDLYGDSQGQSAGVTRPQAVPTVAPADSQQPVAAVNERPPLPPNTVSYQPNTVRYQDQQAGGGDTCPDHGTAWTVKAAGTSRAGKDYRAFWKCDGKTNGSYCALKPVKAWVDAHPADAAADDLPF